MSSLVDLQGLLSQLEQLNLNSLDPQLEQQLLVTATAVKSTLNAATIPMPIAPPSGLAPARTGILEARDTAPSSTIEFEAASLGGFTPGTTVLTETSAAAMLSSEINSPNKISTSTAAPLSLEANKPPEETPIREPRRAFPWVALNPDDYPPPEKAYIKKGQRREFGIPLKGVLPLEPPLHLFQWPEESLSTRGKPDIERLVPAPPAEPPQEGCYPQAPDYICNTEPDRSYRAGYRFAAPFYPSEREDLKRKMLDVRMPPKVTPTKFDMETCSFLPEPIPGMVKLPLGIPLVHHINGDPKRAVTVVCAHTLETLMGYEEGPQVAALIPRLMELTWGKAESDEGPAIPAVFQLPFMQKNLRSKNGAAMKGVVDGDGSFNLASTHGEGEGHGYFMPAVQTNTPETAAIQNEIRTILGKLFRLIAPTSVSRFEWDMMEFAGLQNNVVAFGGLEPGPTSCQANASVAANVYSLPGLEDGGVVGAEDGGGIDAPAATQTIDAPAATIDAPAATQTIDAPAVTQTIDAPATTRPINAPAATRTLDLANYLFNMFKKAMNLEDSIGPQGSPHLDPKDDLLWFTLFVLFLRLPPGSDMGAFLWLRGGIYLREVDTYVLFATFKGQDIHTGSAPSYVKQLKDAMISMDAAKTLFKQFGDHIRCGYVLYPSMGATTHSTQHLYTPSLRFVHHPSDGRDRQYYMTGDGPNVLGDRRAQANRFGQEGAFGFKNWFAQANVDLGISVNTLLESATYRDEKGVLRALRGTEMDVDDDEQYKMITLYRRFYFWWLDVLSTYSLGITKADFKAHQKALKARIEGGAPRPKVLPTEHNILPRLRHHIPSVESSHVIRRIISRRQQGAEALWTVVLEGSEEDIDVVEKNTPWLSVGENGVKCLQYILKYGTGPPPQTTPASAGIEIPSTESNFVSHAPPAVNSGSSNVVTANSSSTEPLIRPLLPRTDPAVHASTSTQGGSSAQAGALLKRKRGHQQEPTVDSDGAQVISDTEPEGNSKRRRKKNLNTVVSDSESEQPPPQKPKRKRKTPVFSESEMSEMEEQPQGKGKEPLFLPSDHEDSDVDEFEVEEIIAWRDQEGETEWLVRWKGFGPEDDTWLGLDRLDGAHELLHAFNHDHGLSLPSGSTPSSTHSTPSPAPSSDEEFPEPKPGNPRGRRVSRLIGGDIEEAWKPDKKALNTEFLGRLLDPVTLLQERTDLEVAAKVLEQKQNIRLAGTESSRDIASRIVDQIEVHNDLSTQMYFELPSVAAGTWGSRLARLTLECVANIGTNVPNLVSVGQIQDLVSRGIRSQVCRALVATYQWLVHLGPSLAAHLIAVHEDKGVDSLREEFPALAPMVEHVLGFVGEERAWRQRKVSSKGKKTRGRKPARQVGRPRTVDLSPAEGTEEPQAPAKKPSTYARAPKDLWGLLPSAKSSTIALAVPPANTKMVTDEQVRQVAITTLCQLWDDNLILDPMRAVDEYFGKQRIKKSASARVNVRERCITRGAILQSLADAFGDGIFACSAMQSFLIQPSRLFASNLARDTLFARAVERDEYGTLKALDDHLAGVLAEAPEVRDACMELAELVHRGLLSLKLGRSMSDEEYENPYTYSTSEHSLSTLSLSATKGKPRVRKHLPDIRPTLATLLPKIPEFGVAAIIVREALSERRDKPATPGTTVFRRLLTAHHPSTGAPTRQDRDQMDPIRADLQSFRWLRKLIPFDELRTGSGLSSLLVYMGTGQGSGTLEFLENRDVVPGKMHFKSLDEAVEVFTVMENRAVSFPNMEIKYENPCVYGQVNSWYSLHPKYSVRGQTVELTIREKLGAYFEEELQTRWVALVGPDSPKPEWEDVLRWILHSELRGFGSGLGALQFANNIVLAGLANPPSPATMAQWIYLNKGFGAFAGLKALGFQLPDNASPAAVRAAFFCFYKWFETYLTEEDKETVHFGTIFAEQLLCKVGRWKKRMMKSMGKKDLSVMARPLFEGKPWTPGENWDDHTKWPIPSAQDFPLSVFKSIVEDGGTELDIEEDNEDDTMDVDT